MATVLFRFSVFHSNFYAFKLRERMQHICLLSLMLCEPEFGKTLLMHLQHGKCEQPISLAKIKFQTNRGWLRNVQVWCSPNDTIVGRWRSSLLFILENNRIPKCQTQWVSIPWNLIHYRNNNKDPRSKTIFSPSLFPLPSFPLPTK